MAVSDGLNLANGYATGAPIGATTNTDSVTLAAGRLYFLTVGTRWFGTWYDPTVTGWTFIHSEDNSETGRTTTVLWRLGGGVGAHTITQNTATEAYRRFWAIDEIQGNHATTPVVQHVGSNATSQNPESGALSAFADATNNGTFCACLAVHASDLVARAGLTRLVLRTDSERFATEWRAGEDLTPGFTNGASGFWSMVAIEIAAASGAADRGMPRGMSGGLSVMSGGMQAYKRNHSQVFVAELPSGWHTRRSGVVVRA
jgi:hypothetical protein